MTAVYAVVVGAVSGALVGAAAGMRQLHRQSVRNWPHQGVSR